MTTVNYKIPSINCNHCVHTIKSELSEMQGIKSVEADLSTKQVTIQYDSPATAEAIEAVLEDINYPVEK